MNKKHFAMNRMALEIYLSSKHRQYVQLINILMHESDTK